MSRGPKILTEAMHLKMRQEQAEWLQEHAGEYTRQTALLIVLDWAMSKAPKTLMQELEDLRMDREDA